MRQIFVKNPYPGIFVGCIIFIAVFILRLTVLHLNNTDVAGIEQNVIYSIQTLLGKSVLYSSPSLAPFSVTQYTPLYYHLCALTAKTLGFNANNIGVLYFIGRSWCLVFNLVTAWLLYVIAHHIFRLPLAWALFLFTASFALSFTHNFAVRPDSMQDAFGMASVACLLMYTKANNRNIWLLLAGVLLSALCFFTKQSGMQYILIFGVFTLLRRDWKTLGITVLASLVFYGALLALFLTKEPSFLENIVGGVVNGINIHNFLKYIIGKNIFIISIWPLAIISAMLIIKENSFTRGNYQSRFLAALLAGIFLFATVTALKSGATVQYYVVFINLAVLYCIKTLLQHQVFNPYRKFWLPAFQLFVVFLMATYFAFNYRFIKSLKDDQSLALQRQSAVMVATYLNNQMAKYPGKYVFANLSTDTHIPSRQSINNLLYKSCLVPQLDIPQYSIGLLKVLGYGSLNNLLKAGKVEFIVTSVPELDFKILSDIDTVVKSDYKSVKTLNGYVIYQFKKQ